MAASADAYVRDGSANHDRNFGTATSLLVRKSSTNKWSYLKFNTSAAPSVSRARLRLYGAATASIGTTLRTSTYSAADTSWGESTITWNNKPATGVTPLATLTVDPNTTVQRWYEWDITAYLQQERAAGRTVVTLVLRDEDTSSADVSFRSRENSSNKPVLVITP